MSNTADLMQALRSEAKALRRELERNPVYVRLDLIEALIENYESDQGPHANGSDPAEDPLKTEVVNVLRSRGPLHWKEVAKHLGSKGLMPAAQDPDKAMLKRMRRMQEIQSAEGIWSLVS